MRHWFAYLFILLSGFAFKSHKAPVTKWVVMSGCSLKVDGSTNINQFSCAITNYSRPDTILVSRSAHQPIQLNGHIGLDVHGFDCRNPPMTADLRKTLKAKEFPKLTIRFLSIAQYPDLPQKVTKGIVAIELAGVSKGYEVDYRVVSASGSYLHLVGSREVKFTDFNIRPPRKLGGMIYTNNELSVVFNLKLKVL